MKLDIKEDFIWGLKEAGKFMNDDDGKAALLSKLLIVVGGGGLTIGIGILTGGG